MSILHCNHLFVENAYDSFAPFIFIIKAIVAAHVFLNCGCGIVFNVSFILCFSDIPYDIAPKVSLYLCRRFHDVDKLQELLSDYACSPSTLQPPCSLIVEHFDVVVFDSENEVGFSRDLVGGIPPPFERC